MIPRNDTTRACTRRRPTAFSLLELIVALVVIGLLAAIAIPTFGRTVGASQVAADKTTLTAVAREAAALAQLDHRPVSRSDVVASINDCTGCEASPLPDLSATGGTWRVVGHNYGTGPVTDPAAPESTEAGTYGWILGTGWNTNRIHLVMASREPGQFIHTEIANLHVTSWANTDPTPDGEPTPPEPPPPVEPEVTVTNLTYNGPGQDGGLFWHLGTNGGATTFTNPTGPTTGLVDTAATSGTPDALTDRNPSSNWFNNDAGYHTTVTWDLGPHITLEPDRWELRTTGTTSRRPSGVRWYGSNDNNTWTTLYEVTGQPLWSTGTWFTDTIDNPGTYRYLRLQIPHTACNCGAVDLAEVEVYGTLTETSPTYTLTFDHLGGEGGLFWHLGTNGGTTSFTNPASPDSGLVDERASHTEGAHRPHNATDRDATTRWSGNCTAGATLQWDLGPHRQLHPTRYEISSDATGSDSPLLRNWALEGSNDGTTWTTIREHVNDTSISYRGDRAGWWLDSPTNFRHLRVRHTGPSTSHANCTSIFEIEFYGNLTATPSTVDHPFAHLGGEGGLFWAAGTNNGTSTFTNPAPDLIGVIASRTDGSHVAARATDRDRTTRWSGNCTAGASITWNLHGRPMTVHRYELSSDGNGSDSPLLRNWALEGSNDGTTWTTIRQHVNDTSINYPGDRAGWWVTPSGPWHQLRLRHTGPSTSHANCTSIFEIEFYGQRP